MAVAPEFWTRLTLTKLTGRRAADLAGLLEASWPRAIRRLDPYTITTEGLRSRDHPGRSLVSLAG